MMRCGGSRPRWLLLLLLAAAGARAQAPTEAATAEPPTVEVGGTSGPQECVAGDGCPCPLGCRRCMVEHAAGGQVTVHGCVACQGGGLLADSYCYRQCDEAGGYTATGDGACSAPATPSVRLGLDTAALKAMEVGYRRNDLRFKFRTSQPCGQLLFLAPELERSDFLALTLQDGQLHLAVNLGRFDASTSTSELAAYSDATLSDGFWHTVRLARTGNRLQLTVDAKHTLDLVVPGTSDGTLDLDGLVFFGRAPAAEFHVPGHLAFCASQGLAACLREVQLDGVVINQTNNFDNAMNLPSCGPMPCAGIINYYYLNKNKNY